MVFLTPELVCGLSLAGNFAAEKRERASGWEIRREIAVAGLSQIERFLRTRADDLEITRYDF